MSKKTLKGFLQLTGISLFIWFFFWVFTPWWLPFSPAHQKFSQAMDDNNIPFDAINYSDIPLSDDAERHLRKVWRNRKKVQAKKDAAAKLANSQ